MTLRHNLLAVFRALTLLSAGASGIIAWKRPPFPLIFAVLLAQAGTPLFALTGAVFGLIGLWRRRLFDLVAGIIAAGLAARYIRRVTAPHLQFDQAFGPDWRTRMALADPALVPIRRWSPFFRPAQPRGSKGPLVVSYGRSTATGESLTATLWEPPGARSRTGMGIVYLHGSAWHFRDRDALTNQLFWRLTQQGHVVLKIEYTLAPVAGLEEQIGDIRQAIAWLKNAGREFGVHPGRIALIGGSAGGHLALLSAYTAGDPRFGPSHGEHDHSVCAVVSYGGLTDLAMTYEQWRERFSSLIFEESALTRLAARLVEPLYHRAGILPPGGRILPLGHLLHSLLGGTPLEVPDRYRLGSPLFHIRPGCPPTLQLQGENDSGIRDGAERLHQALRRLGVQSCYIEFADSQHAFDVPLWSPAGQAAASDLVCFLALVLTQNDATDVPLSTQSAGMMG